MFFSENILKKIPDILPEQIPFGLRYCIYGANDYAVLGRNILQVQRPDLKFVCYVDSANEGLLLDDRVVKVENLPKIKNEFDIVLINSSEKYEQEIKDILFSFGIDNVFLFKNKLLRNVVEVLKKDSFFLKLHQPEYWEKNKHLKNKVIDILLTQEDKELYSKLFDLRHKKEDRELDFQLDSFIEFKKENKSFDSKYFDFINKNAIKTIIDAGVFDGFTTNSFLYRIPDLKKIYAFDPFLEESLLPPYKQSLTSNKKVQLENLGLSDRKGTMDIFFSGAGSNFYTKEESLKIKKTRQLTSIDEYINDNNITDKIDYIKADIEGGEYLMLKGAEKTIKKDRPQLAISIYHMFYSQGDLFELPLYLNGLLENYIFRLGHYSFRYAETILYCIPEELYSFT